MNECRKRSSIWPEARQHPVLTFPDFKQQLAVETDLASISVGAVRLQKKNDYKFHLVHFLIRTINSCEITSRSAEEECCHWHSRWANLEFSSCYYNHLSWSLTIMTYITLIKRRGRMTGRLHGISCRERTLNVVQSCALQFYWRLLVSIRSESKHIRWKIRKKRIIVIVKKRSDDLISFLISEYKRLRGPILSADRSTVRRPPRSVKRTTLE